MNELHKSSVIRLQGNLDERNVSEIEQQLLEIVQTIDELILDLNELEILDISGIFMLFGFKQNMRNKGKNITFLLDPSKVISGNTFGIKIPKLI